jgi:hypothetical protein
MTLFITVSKAVRGHWPLGGPNPPPSASKRNRLPKRFLAAIGRILRGALDAESVNGQLGAGASPENGCGGHFDRCAGVKSQDVV